MTAKNRKIIILPFALEEEGLRSKSDFLGRQIPIYLRNCFEKQEPGRVVASPIATEKSNFRYWVVHKDLWRDDAARSFARERGYDIVVFGILSGPSSEGSIRTLRLKSLMVESGKILVDKTITGDIFRIMRTSLEGLSVYASMIPRDAAALFTPETESAPAFENYLRGLDVLLALRSDGIQLNNYEKALEPFKRALRIDGEFGIALTAGLSCALQAVEPQGEKMTTEVIQEAIESWMEISPLDHRNYAVLAEILLERGDLAGSLAVLQRGLEFIQPPSRDLLRRSGDLLSQLGKHKEALSAYETCETLGHEAILVERMSGLNIMLGNAKAARRQLDSLLVEDPARSDLWLRAGLLAQRDKDLDSAWIYFSRMFDSDASPSVSELTKLNAVLGKATAGEPLTTHLRTWYPPESMASEERLLFSKTLRLAGSRMEAGLCLSSIRVEDLDAAKKSLLARERLNLLHEGFDSNFAELAQRIVNDGSIEGREILDETVSSEPDFWPARFLRGLIFSKLGDYQQSFEEMNIILEVEPENDIVWYTRGLQLARLGNDVDAVASFDTAIRLNGKETDYHANLALSHARLQHQRRAMEALEEVKTLRPQDPENDRLQQAIENYL
ncbi:MAG: tetratricopeptide (TPR) repeat protein [Planctomycetota bacterium]|jgi:tetratricopeptide (TPR) repeat protein